jgi:hypothetical protein
MRESRGQGEAGGSNRTMYWILGGAAVLALLVMGWNVFSSLTDSTAREPVDLDYDSPRELLEMAQPVESGDPAAPIRIMEFSDYQCPACQGFFRGVKPMLDREFVAEGRALFAYYDFPLVDIHRNAFLAARAARCAGDQDAYWPTMTGSSWARPSGPGCRIPPDASSGTPGRWDWMREHSGAASGATATRRW